WYDHKIQEQVQAVTEVMFHDVVNPPAAARFYAYILLTGYATLSFGDNSLPAFQLFFKDFPRIVFDKPGPVDYQFACIYGILETAKGILPSGHLLEDRQQQILKEYAKLQSDSTVTYASWLLASYIAQSIIKYSRTDGYFSLSTKARYTPITGE